MKILLLSLVLLFTSISFAQLYVQPSATADSYVFVNDQILYVEQDVNLVRNAAGPTEASIYLRNGAQMIQGDDGLTINDGNGDISVYQNAPDSDQWTYNYWCSPVGNPGSGFSGNRNFGMYRLYDINNITSSNVTLRTTGYDGTHINSGGLLTISSRWLYIHPRGFETEGDYIRVNASNNVPVGFGFTMKGVDPDPLLPDGFEYDFRGRPNNGNIPVTVYDNELTLSGNPYPSALDLNRVFYDSDNSEIIQFEYWDEDKDANSHYYSQNAGGYGTWIPGSSDPNGEPGDIGFQDGLYAVAQFFINSAGGPGTTYTGDGDHYERRFAPIGQGFMIKPNANGQIIIKNEHRRYIKEGVGNYSQFRSPGASLSSAALILPPPPPSDTRIPQIRIHTTFGESHFRDMVLAFSDESTDGFDRGFDARHPMDAAGGDAYFPIGPDSDIKKYVIQTVPFDLGKTIPIVFKVNAQTALSVKAVEEVNIDNNAYLWDSLENTFTKITGGQSADFILPAGHYTERFFIVFRDQMQTISSSITAGVREQILESVSFFQNNPASQLEISNPEGYEIKSASMYDMSGKLVLSENNVGNESHFTFYTGNLSNGVYLVKLVTKDDIQIDYKAIVNNRG